MGDSRGVEAAVARGYDRSKPREWLPSLLRPAAGNTSMNVSNGLRFGPAPPGHAGATSAGRYDEDQTLRDLSDERGAKTVTINDDESRVDDRVIRALESYLDSLRAGRAYSRAEFLAEHADISPELQRCFGGLEFVEAAVAGLPGVSVAGCLINGEPGLSPQTRLGDFEVLREIGRGGMGIVYEARQVSLGRRVALKVLPHAAAGDPKQRQRFQIEAQAAAQLHHPHIVPVFGVGCDAGIHYYAMQYVDGQSLSTIIRDLRAGLGEFPSWAEPSMPGEPGRAPHSPPGAQTAGKPRPADDMPEPAAAPPPAAVARGDTTIANQARDSGSPAIDGSSVGVHKDLDFCRKVARLGTQASEALEHAHSLGVLHRDIKPANLLIDREGSVWITDFGLARFSSDSSLTGTGDVIGTLRYMSPEQALARRGVVDQRTDIYALGATIYELLTLRPAFDGRDHQELLRQITLDEPTPPRRLNPVVPRDLETIVLKAMAKEPSGRYTTAQEFSDDLTRFLNYDSIRARRPSLLERVTRWGRRHRQLVAVLAASLIFCAVVSLVYGRRAEVALKQTEIARNRYRDYIITHFPLLDRSAVNQVAEASAQLQSASDPAARERAFEVYDEILKLFQEASALPPTDVESRIVIARALCRLAYTRTMLGLQKGTPQGPDPALAAAAGQEFERSFRLFESLLAEKGKDRTICRYLADAFGLNGMGCLLRFTHRPHEAEQFYKRAIEIRRELARGVAAAGDAGRPPQTDEQAERENLSLLVFTVEVVASMMEADGRSVEARDICKQLEADVAAAAARFQGDRFRDTRRRWSNELMTFEADSPHSSVRRMGLMNAKLAVLFDPQNVSALNNAAWTLVNTPDDPWFDPNEGLALAQKAVALEPDKWAYWNTLGVAAFRAGEFITAQDALQQSVALNGGKPHDWFFLAMTKWAQGHRPEACRYFDKAVAALKVPHTEDTELTVVYTEAAKLMGLPGPGLQVGRGAGPDPRSQPRHN